MASENTPWLDNETLWIRGYDKSSDDMAVSYTYKTEREAKKALEGFTYLIKSFNGTCPCNALVLDSGAEVTIVE